MQFNLFGYDVTITITDANPEMKVKSIVNREIKIIMDAYPNRYRKIEMIKILRRPEVSAILIQAGKVPQSEIADVHTEKPYVGLAWAKCWIEEQYPETIVVRK